MAATRDRSRSSSFSPEPRWFGYVRRLFRRMQQLQERVAALERYCDQLRAEQLAMARYLGGGVPSAWAPMPGGRRDAAPAPAGSQCAPPAPGGGHGACARQPPHSCPAQIMSEDEVEERIIQLEAQDAERSVRRSLRRQRRAQQLDRWHGTVPSSCDESEVSETTSDSAGPLPCTADAATQTTDAAPAPGRAPRSPSPTLR